MTHSGPLNELFFIEVDRTATRPQPSQFFLSDAGVDTITLPGGLVTAAHPKTWAVYVGAVRYSRDDFFAITDVQVVDRYTLAAAAVRSRYGIRHHSSQGFVAPNTLSFTHHSLHKEKPPPQLPAAGVYFSISLIRLIRRP
ncbi:MAG: hypothetical protein ACJAVT_001218 [Yoonia sp.]